jgi:hypothetical protein
MSADGQADCKGGLYATEAAAIAAIPTFKAEMLAQADPADCARVHAGSLTTEATPVAYDCWSVDSVMAAEGAVMDSFTPSAALAALAARADAIDAWYEAHPDLDEDEDTTAVAEAELNAYDRARILEYARFMQAHGIRLSEVYFEALATARTAAADEAA